MNHRTFLITLLFSAVSLLFTPPLRAEEKLTEHAKIEALIGHLEGLQDATFIRNGSEYNSKNAAKFIRGKWDANKKEIHTVQDFITKAATQSSTTGKPYVIRLKGAADMNCADYLNAQLKKIVAN
jgi:Family of unknown function (DUF5329)